MVKNKVAAPFREAEFDIIYGEGISREGDLLDLGVDNNIVEKSGSWFSYKGERIGQGRENARQFLKDNKETFVKLETEVRKTLGLIPASAHARVRYRDGRVCAGREGCDHARSDVGNGEATGGEKIEGQSFVRGRCMVRGTVHYGKTDPPRREALAPRLKGNL